MGNLIFVFSGNVQAFLMYPRSDTKDLPKCIFQNPTYWSAKHWYQLATSKIGQMSGEEHFSIERCKPKPLLSLISVLVHPKETISLGISGSWGKDIDLKIMNISLRPPWNTMEMFNRRWDGHSLINKIPNCFSSCTSTRCLFFKHKWTVEAGGLANSGNP